MPKIVFSSEHLPPHLPHTARASAWIEQFEVNFGKIEINPMVDVPFRGHIEAVPVADMALAMMSGSLADLRRTKKGIIADGLNSPVFIVNLSEQPFQLDQRGRETLVAPGGAILFDEAATGKFSLLDPAAKSLSVMLPRAALSSSVKHLEDMVAEPLDAALDSLRMLKMYADSLLASGGPHDPATAHLVGSHLADLVALTLGAGRDATEIARQRGLRAGRLNSVLAAINAGFSDPAFSLRAIAQKERVSERYLRDLLHESETGFAERVLELRLQHAHRRLTNLQHSHRKITDIVLSSGFNDVSYFNRCFRSRFGMTPRDARATAAAAMADGHGGGQDRAMSLAFR
jgi:AraC-like DNA-binding protein